jgi:hypothetical protein
MLLMFHNLINIYKELIFTSKLKVTQFLVEYADVKY